MSAGKHKDFDERMEERRLMVECQIAARGVHNKAVLDAMHVVPRHVFVPSELQGYAYEDHPLPIGEGQTISQPYIVALMTEALEPKKSHKVLEIGTGSGYAAAVLSRIVSKVYTIERLNSLATSARKCFEKLDYGNIETGVKDGTKGWPEKGPFDGIIVSAAARKIPTALKDQLKSGGHMVIPVEGRFFQTLLKIHKNPDGSFEEEKLCAVTFVPLV